MKYLTIRAFLGVLTCSLLVTSVNMAEAMTFRVSSMGYHPQGAKVAILEDIPADQDVKVTLFDPSRRNPRLPVFLGTTVYEVKQVREGRKKGQQGPPTKDLLLDFSEFQEPGQYELRIDGVEGVAKEVRITDYLYWDTLKPVVKTFYFQRCGQDVEDRLLKLFHSACHLKDANYNTGVRPPGTFDDEDGLDVIGGWHDGADYAKHTSSTALAAARLMALQEWNPKPFRYFRLDYPLFEPGYGSMADLHHEIKAGLDWLMVMQRRDGAFYRKVAGKQWPGAVIPEEDEQERLLYGITTQDTANAAAAFAMAVRNFKKTDLGYSIRALMVAEKAWLFLEKNPQRLVKQTPSDASGSVEYLDSKRESDLPYRVWAAAELYVSTGKAPYHRYFLAHANTIPLEAFSWRNPALQGILDYLLYAPAKEPKTEAILRQKILTLAKGIEMDLQSGFWPSGLKQYRQGSNQELTERANLLMVAYRLSGQAHYRDAASQMLSYLFGVNPLGMTYITGLSEKSVSHPAHRWLEANGKLAPGFLVNGPHEGIEHASIPKNAGAMSYADEPIAAVNESSLLNNASLAFVLATLNDAYNVGKDDDEGKNDTLPGLNVKLAPERPKAK